MRGSYPKFRVIALALCCALLFSLCGCGGKNDNTKTLSSEATSEFSETINNVEWRVSYNSKTRAIVSITGTATEYDRTSSYYKYIARYHGDSNMYALHILILSGTPIGDNWYKIEQVEKYDMPYMTEGELARVQLSFPSCTFNAQDRTITLSERTTRYEERLVFGNMSD